MSATMSRIATSMGLPPLWVMRLTTSSGECGGICSFSASASVTSRAEMKSVAASITRLYSDSRNEYRPLIPFSRFSMPGAIDGTRKLVIRAIGVPLAIVTRSIFTTRSFGSI